VVTTACEKRRELIEKKEKTQGPFCWSGKGIEGVGNLRASLISVNRNCWPILATEGVVSPVPSSCLNQDLLVCNKLVGKKP
jgi:hypothetical protein